MARKEFSCDFETTTDPNDCRVWAYAYMEIGNKKNMKIGNNIDEFMRFCEKEKANLYFHNLRFDGEFIVNWLFKNGWTWEKDGGEKTFHTTISNMGQWYKIDICYGRKGRKKLHTVIYDSYKKLPFSVKDIAKSFKLDIRKGELDYDTYRPVGHVITDEEKEYIINDVEIIADALQIQFSQSLTAMTSGKDSMDGFKASISKKIYEKFFPTFSIALDSEIRKAYKGGFTWLHDRHQEKFLGEGIVFDVNSLYPSQMYMRELPFGDPIPFEGEYEQDDDYPLHIIQVKCAFELKDGYIPTIQIKGSRFRQNEYLKSSDGDIVDLYITNIDWNMIQEHYHLADVTYVGGWKFRSSKGIFKSFIDKWMHVKTHEKGAKKALAKLMLNSLYGKFASNPDVTGKVPYLKEDGSLGFFIGDYEEKDPVYTPMGVFITSWARYTTISAAQKCYDRIIYCDTDSIHLTGTDIPDSIKDLVDDDKLGYWAYEGTFKRAIYIRQKTYMYELYGKRFVDADGDEQFEATPKDEATDTKVTVKCAGMPDRVKKNCTFISFQRGFTSMGKLTPKHVNNGIVLVDSPFTLK